MNGQRGMRAALGLVSFLLLGSACWLAWGWVLDLELLGWDSYPLVAASAVGSLGEVARTFGEELMGGRYDDGAFYRPLTHLAFAHDAGRGTLLPAVYHLTDLTLAVVCAWLIGRITARLAPGAGAAATWVGSFAAGLLFLLHPVQLEVLPYAPRRADTLALGFVLISLLVQRPERTRWIATAVTVGAAALSKETGFVALPLVVLWHACVCGEGGAETRLRAALRRSAPAFVAAAAALAGRTAVLGGLGGHAGPSAWSLGEWPRLLGQYLRWTASANGTGVALLWLAPFLVVLGAFGFRELSSEEDAEPTCPDLGAALFVAAWFDGSCLLALASGRAHGWYALWLIVPLALTLGAGLVRAVDRLSQQRFGLREAAVAVALAISALLVRAGGLAQPDGAFAETSALMRAQLETLRLAVDGTPEGSSARIDEWLVALPRHDAKNGFVFGLAPYSVEAYLELIGVEAEVTAENGGLVLSR